MGAYLAWTPGTTDGTDVALIFDVVTNENPRFPTQITEHVVETGADVTDNIRVGLRSVTLEVFVSNEPLVESPQWGGPGSVASLGPINTPDTQQADPPSPGPSLDVPVWFQLPIGIPLAGPLLSATGLSNQTTTIQAVAGLKATKGVQINPMALQFSSPFDAVQLTHDQLETLRTTRQIMTVFGTKGTYPNMAIESFELDRTIDDGTGGRFTIELKEVRFVSSQLVAAPSPSKPRGKTPTSKGSTSTTTASSGTSQSALKALKSLFSGQSVPGVQP